MAAPVLTAPQPPRLRHLQVFNDIYAEADHGAYYAYRDDRKHGWRLVSRDRVFTPTDHLTVEACDAELTVARVRRICRDEGHPVQTGANACYCAGGPDGTGELDDGAR